MKQIYYIIVVTFLFTVQSDAKSFKAIAPEGFALYKEDKHFRAVSPEHVVYRVRTCKNQPFAEFDFWREALPEQMKNAGYRIINDTVLTSHNNRSLLLEMAAPVSGIDYSYMVMIQVKGDKILIAEAAGVFDALQLRKKEIFAALEKLVLK